MAHFGLRPRDILGGQFFLDDLAVDHEAREVGQPPRDAVLLARLAPDLPAHPLLGGSVDRVRQGETGVHLVQDVIRKVAAVAAVEEGPDRVQGLTRGICNRGHGRGPRGGGVFGHCSPKAPGFVLSGRDVRGGRHGHLHGGVVAMTL